MKAKEIVELILIGIIGLMIIVFIFGFFTYGLVLYYGT